MKPKNYLLPHYFQKIGWGLFVFSFIFLLGSIYVFNTLKLLNQNYSPYATFIFYFILLFSALFVAFSREKTEDELIQNIRYSSIVFVSYLGFIIYSMLVILSAINQSFNILTDKSFSYFILINPITLFMVYVVIFRARLFILNRALKNEE